MAAPLRMGSSPFLGDGDEDVVAGVGRGETSAGFGVGKALSVQTKPVQAPLPNANPRISSLRVLQFEEKRRLDVLPDGAFLGCRSAPVDLEPWIGPQRGRD